MKPCLLPALHLGASLACALALLLGPAGSAATEAPRLAGEPPRLRALLEQAWAVENGAQGQPRDEGLAAQLYCDAARHGSAEGHYQAGRLYLQGPEGLRDPVNARSFLGFAHELGHAGAAKFLASLAHLPVKLPGCLQGEKIASTRRFDLEGYVVHLQPTRREVASLVARLAPQYGVDVKLALAIAATESNFDPQARSPKNALGVMQLIPATAARFKVKDPLDAEDNIRGGLAYLRWLGQRFAGDVQRVVAAYNAGEGAVERHGGVPPYFETQTYVSRVLSLTARTR